jgi:molecular chaperone GrpE
MQQETIQDTQDAPDAAEMPQNEQAPSDTPIEEVNPEAQQQPEAGSDDWRDRYLRLASDFENYKRRNVKEREMLLRNANTELVRVFLPLLDDLGRAMAAAQQSDNVESIKTGLALIERNTRTALEKQGVKAIEALGQPFDSNLHEAIAAMPAPAPDQKGIVLDVVENGYYYQDNVIRYAKVIIGE